MIITYLGHSGFLAELEDVYFLFDYYKGEIPKLQKEKPLIVFVSHRHHDHYNRKIWDLRKEYPHVRYVISKDISMSERMRQRFSITEEDLKNILRAAPNQIYEMDIWGKTALKIETFRSTDEGTAFYLTCGKHTLYHAGDLQLWLWQEEGEEWNRDMRNRFPGTGKAAGAACGGCFSATGQKTGKLCLCGYGCLSGSNGRGLRIPHALLGRLRDHRRIQRGKKRQALYFFNRKDRKGRSAF